jgi:hypothetical protein
LRKGNTLKVDVVGENTKRRRLMVVALFIPKLVNTKSGEKAEHPRRRKSFFGYDYNDSQKILN